MVEIKILVGRLSIRIGKNCKDEFRDTTEETVPNVAQREKQILTLKEVKRKREYKENS